MCVAMTFGAVDVAVAQEAQIGEKTYATLRDAFSASTDNGVTIKLVSDVDLTGIKFSSKSVRLAANKVATLDLNGHSIKAASRQINGITVSGNLTLIDSKENSTGKIYSESDYLARDDHGVIRVISNGSFTMNSGYIYTVHPTDPLNNGQFGVEVWGKGKVTINGGKIESGWYSIAGNGSDSNSNTTVTINGGTIISTTDYAVYNPQNGKVIVNDGGTIYGNAGGIAMKRGELAVNGGTITSKGTGDTGNWGDGTGNLGNAAINFKSPYGNVSATINGGTITAEGDALAVDATPTSGKTVSVSIKGGTFSGETSSIEPYVDEGSLVKTENGKVTVQADYYLAKVGDTKYTSLSDAINAATTGNTIKILNDVNTPTASYKISDKKLTFDLNGKTVKANQFFALSNADLTFMDATATAEPVVDDNYNVTYDAGTFYGELFAMNGGSISIESGKYIDSKNCLFNAYGDEAGVKSTVNVNGGYLESQESTVTARYKGATININGGVMVAKDNAVVAGNGSKGVGGTTINISGGTMIGHIQSAGYVACGVYHPQSGELNISGGKIVALGGAGIVMRGGRLNQTGGEIIASGEANLTGKVGDSRVVVGTTGIVFDRDANYYDAPNATVAISGEAKVSGTKAAVEVLNTNGVANAEDAVEVKGGTFSSDVSDYCADGYAAAPTGNGTYGIVTGDLLIVTDNGYPAFSAADKKFEFSLADVSRIVVNSNVADATVKMTGNFKEDKWTSFYVPFDIKLTSEILNKFEFAEIWDTELVNGATTIEYKKLGEGETATANTPCLIKTKAGSDNILELTGTEIKKPSNAVFDCSTLKQKFSFVGVLENTTLKDKYGYYLDVDNQIFTAASYATTFVRPTKFYMTIQNRADDSYVYPTDESAAKTVGFRVIGDDVTTGINELQSDNKFCKNRVYSLQGVYLSDSVKGLQPGMYIVNGKKITVK